MDFKTVNGAIYTRNATQLRLWSPNACAVAVRLFTAGTDAEGAAHLGAYPMTPSKTGVWTLELPGDYHGVYYDYVITDGSGKRTVSNDPWAKACGVNSSRSMIVDLERTNPEGWENDRAPAAQKCAPVIWETHVRDFSADPSSGVRPAWRGKYLGFTEKETTLDSKGELPTCLTYLKELGITHIQLQPIADYYTVDEVSCKNYNWGYDIENYNIPEGSYATDPYHGEVRIRECKAMIKAIHEAGLRVVLDVVYNHTYHKDSPLARTAPGAYYRHGWSGDYLNASGCGNETASEREPFRNFMVNSILYWAKEYHVDGFRFDLMGIHDTETMNIIRKELDKLPGGRDILTIGEPWYALPPGLSYPHRPAIKDNMTELDDRIASFADGTRDAIAGSVGELYDRGYVLNHLKYWSVYNIKSAVCGWCDNRYASYVKAPSQVVQYASCHDNFALWDRFSAQTDAEDYDGQNEKAEKLTKLASGIYLTCLGIGFMQSGEEFGRSKHGLGNTYNGPANRNTLYWKLTEKHSGLVDWYRGILNLRRLMVGELTLENAKQTRFLESGNTVVAYERPAAKDCGFESFIVCCNPTVHDFYIHLPAGEWLLLCDGEDSNLIESSAKAYTGSFRAMPERFTVLGKRKPEMK